VLIVFIEKCRTLGGELMKWSVEIYAVQSGEGLTDEPETLRFE
jgi:hypothetical protein